MLRIATPTKEDQDLWTRTTACQGTRAFVASSMGYHSYQAATKISSNIPVFANGEISVAQMVKNRINTRLNITGGNFGKDAVY